MINDLGLGIVVSMKDAFTQNATRIQSAMMSLDATVAKSSERMNRNLDRIQKGTMMVGAGIALLSIPTAFLASTAATQKALGELASVGVVKMRAIEESAEGFTNRWAGANKAEFIGAAYDVKSALANLSDEAVGTFSAMAALTGKATKATTQEMVGTFTTAYGIFKPIMGELNDIEWAKAFSGALAQTVAAFKTNGPQMADAIKNVGATAAASNIPLSEQLAILGQLQTTMPGSEAGTLYKAFIMKAAEAGTELGLQFTDASGRIKGVIPILQEIQRRFPDMSQAAAQVKIKKAFGSDEAVKFVLQMSAGMQSLQGNIKSVADAMHAGTATTESMANAMNQDIGSQFTLIRQQFTNLSEILGRTLIPVFTPILQCVSSFVLRLQTMAKSMPGVTRVVLTFSMGLGALLVVAGSVIASIGMLGVMLPAVQAGFVALSTAAAGVGASIATYLLPVVAIIAGVTLAALLLKSAWQNNFAGIRDIVQGAWSRIRLAFTGIRQLITSLSSGVGQMSTDVAQKLQSAGLLNFVVTVFKVYYRVREYLMGLWGAFSQVLGRIRVIVEPAVRSLMSAFSALLSALSPLAEAFGFVAVATDAERWHMLGAAIGNLLGIIAQVGAWVIRFSIVPLTLLVRTIAAVVRAGIWMGKTLSTIALDVGTMLYRVSLPMRLLVSTFTAAQRIIAAAWRVLRGEATAYEGMKAVGAAVLQFIATPFIWAGDLIKGFWDSLNSVAYGISSFAFGIMDSIQQTLSGMSIEGIFENTVAAALKVLSGGKLFFQAGRELLKSLGEGILSALSFPFNALRQVMGTIKGVLPLPSMQTNVSSSQQSISSKPISNSLTPGKFNLIPNVLSKLLPTAVSGTLMLTPVMSNSAPAMATHSVLSTPEALQNKPSQEYPHLSRDMQERLASASLAPAKLVAGQTNDTSNRDLLTAIIQRLDTLEKRPIDVQVKTNIDGRQIAEAVYKDIRERKIRNYETL
jgi:TP901 family phage tail tape measure protein